jgi:hypothetical protein
MRAACSAAAAPPDGGPRPAPPAPAAPAPVHTGNAGRSVAAERAERDKREEAEEGGGGALGLGDGVAMQVAMTRRAAWRRSPTPGRARTQSTPRGPLPLPWLPWAGALRARGSPAPSAGAEAQGEG